MQVADGTLLNACNIISCTHLFAKSARTDTGATPDRANQLASRGGQGDKVQGREWPAPPADGQSLRMHWIGQLKEADMSHLAGLSEEMPVRAALNKHIGRTSTAEIDLGDTCDFRDCKRPTDCCTA